MKNTAIKRSDYQPFPYNVENLDLSFELFDDKAIVISKAKYTIKSEFKAGENLLLNGTNLKLLSISMNNEDITKNNCCSLNDEGMLITNPPSDFELIIKTEIHPETNTSLEGLYRESSDVGSTFCTQCEAMGFRKITYYPDRPDVMTKFTTKIEADAKKYPRLLSNGNKIDSGDAGNGRHFAIWQDPWKKPAYLFALVAGDLALTADTYTTIEGRKVALEIYTDEHNANKADFAIESLKKSMKWDEDTFGLAYDLDTYMIVATDSFNMGAMENKGLNVFNSKYVLADPATTTDAGYEGVEAVIGHEYFHNWTGNRVTCRDWFQLTLKEGLTVFRDQEFSSDMQSRSVKRIEEVTIVRNSQFGEDASPMAHPIRPDEVKEMNNFYTSTVYRKGAEVIRMIHTMLGAEGFRNGMDLYFKRHDGKAVTCEDFINAMADATSTDLSQFMATWYFQAGTPEVNINWEYNEKDETLYLKVEQTCPPTPNQPTKKPFHFPLVIGLLDKNGDELKLKSNDKAFDANKSLLNITKQSQTFMFEGVKSNPVPSLFRNFSAPVKVNAQYTIADYLFLMKYDTDDFNRYEAGQKIAVNIMQTMVNSGENMEADSCIIDAFKQVITDVNAGKLDKSIASKMLTLPSTTYVGELMDVINVGLLQKARKLLRKTIATNLNSELLDIYNSNYSSSTYKFTTDEVARRSLQNICLSYLLELDLGADIALNQFNTANKNDNMTDVMAAMSGIINSDSVSINDKNKVLETFYNKWKDDTEVMDKWLSVQASSCSKGTLDIVKMLLKHPVYNETKPNKVRAVIGGFCASGADNFHNIDGSGYDFFADFIIKYDKINPQTAARFVSPLLKWKKMDSTRKSLMKSALEKIQNSGNTSNDVSELVEKGLS